MRKEEPILHHEGRERMQRDRGRWERTRWCTIYKAECRAGDIIWREFRAGYGRLGHSSSLAQTPMCRARELPAGQGSALPWTGDCDHAGEGATVDRPPVANKNITGRYIT